MEFDAARARALLQHADEEERRRAIAEIPEGWTPGALAVLIDALGDESWRVRKDAVMRVARWPDPDGAVPLLIAQLADDTNVGLRNAAVEALTAIGAPSVGPLTTALAAGAHAWAAAALAAWAVLTARFCWRRLSHTSRAARHVLEMVLTSIAIPPLAVFWRLVGAVKFRVPFV